MNTTTNTRGVSEAMVTHQAAAEALDSLDDYARMGIGVDAHGPRGMLERYIAQQAALSTEPAAQGEAVAEVVAHEMDDGYLILKRARLLRDLPFGTKLYTAPPALAKFHPTHQENP